MTRALRRAFLLALLVLAPSLASARTNEPGAFLLGPVIGPSFKLPTLLGGAPAYFVLGGQAEYALDSRLSLLGDFTAGFASTYPLRFHGGIRLRPFDTGTALSPYAQLQLGLGGLVNVIGTNLFWIGGRLAVGTDFFFTKSMAAGGMLAADLGTTTGQRPAFYGAMDVLLYVTFLLS